MSEQHSEELKDTLQKDPESSDSEIAKSEVMDIDSDQPSAGSSSSISVGDEKSISVEILKKVSESDFSWNPEKLEQLPESDSNTNHEITEEVSKLDSNNSFKSSKQESADSSKFETPKGNLPLSTESGKSTEADDRSSNEDMNKKRALDTSRAAAPPSKRVRFESCSYSEDRSEATIRNSVIQKSSPSDFIPSGRAITKRTDYGSMVPTFEDPPLDVPGLPNSERTPKVNINNLFFYTPQTLTIHKEYMKLFDFKKLRHARSLGIKSYDKIVSIEDMPLFLSRFLLEDLLDFVDFLNGTKTKLYRPEKFALTEPFPNAAQVVFVRKNFDTGIQQIESETVKHLLEQLRIYIGSKGNTESFVEAVTLSIKTDTETDLQQSSPDSDQSVVIDLVSDSGSPESDENINVDSPNSSPGEDKILQLDWETEEMSIDDKINYLSGKKREIVRLMFRCLCDTRLVLDFCQEADYRDDRVEEFGQRLKKYLSHIKDVLETLAKIREECNYLLNRNASGNDESNIFDILHIKISVANVIKQMLQTLSAENAIFLENDFS